VKATTTSRVLVALAILNGLLQFVLDWRGFKWIAGALVVLIVLDVWWESRS
jgi:hypothetical protein